MKLYRIKGRGRLSEYALRDLEELDLSTLPANQRHSLFIELGTERYCACGCNARLSGQVKYKNKAHSQRHRVMVVIYMSGGKRTTIRCSFIQLPGSCLF